MPNDYADGYDDPRYVWAEAMQALAAFLRTKDHAYAAATVRYFQSYAARARMGGWQEAIETLVTQHPMPDAYAAYDGMRLR